jgi:hypothetical protein
MAEITDHGQQCDLRTRRGADFSLQLALTDALASPVNIAGATCVSRIFADGKPDVVFSSVVTGALGLIVIGLSAGQTADMQQNWNYVVGYKDAAGATHPLMFGAFYVSQEKL